MWDRAVASATAGGSALLDHRWLRRLRSNRLETTDDGAGTGPPLIEPVEMSATSR
jgi:hypothetical protein